MIYYFSCLFWRYVGRTQIRVGLTSSLYLTAVDYLTPCLLTAAGLIIDFMVQLRYLSSDGSNVFRHGLHRSLDSKVSQCEGCMIEV